MTEPCIAVSQVHFNAKTVLACSRGRLCNRTVETLPASGEVAKRESHRRASRQPLQADVQSTSNGT